MCFTFIGPSPSGPSPSGQVKRGNGDHSNYFEAHQILIIHVRVTVINRTFFTSNAFGCDGHHRYTVQLGKGHDCMVSFVKGTGRLVRSWENTFDPGRMSQLKNCMWSPGMTFVMYSVWPPKSNSTLIIMQFWRTGQAFVAFIAMLLHGFSHGDVAWSYPNSVYFLLTLFSTSGYVIFLWDCR
jgi:hypothetical protein